MPVRPGIVMLAACAVLASGCGGGGSAGSSSSSGSHRAVIPAAMAATLAAQADAVAAAADRGDGCAAVAAVRRLRDGVEVAVASGRIPRRLATPLRSSAAALTAGLSCAPPEDHGKPRKGHGHQGKGHGQGGDEGD